LRPPSKEHGLNEASFGGMHYEDHLLEYEAGRMQWKD
jgi:hypothetical protein